MRVWDLSVEQLCRKHLLGEHRELHAIWSIHVNGKKGYAKHPETIRWKGKLAALYARHDKLVKEMLKRGYKHESPLSKRHATGARLQRAFVDSLKAQRENLRGKGCDCKV